MNKLTRNYSIKFGGDMKLIGYSDADWATCKETRRSVSGNVFMIGQGLITWKSKKQESVALSTAESEYISASLAATDAMWIKKLLLELKIDIGKPVLHMDNQSAIAIANSSGDHNRSKHIDIRVHFLREKVQEGQLVIKHCSTQDQLADLLTKYVSTNVLNKLVILLGLNNELQGMYCAGGVLNCGGTVQQNKINKRIETTHNIDGPMEMKENVINLYLVPSWESNSMEITKTD